MSCLPEPHCRQCGGDVVVNSTPSRRHQVFELPPQTLDITEYQLFHGRCDCCSLVSQGQLPRDTPSGQIGPRLMSQIAVLAGQYHLSLNKIRQLLQDQYGTTFSIGALSEVQGRVSSMLTPVHQALKAHIQKASIIHADETTHPRNDDQSTRCLWLMASDDAVFQNVRFSRSQDNAKHLLGEQTVSVIVTDQCASYNWLDPTRHQFCLAHVKRNLQQMADYSGGGLTARLGTKLVLMVGCIFRIQHRFEQDEISEPQWLRRMQRLRQSINALLQKGTQAPASRYAGRCQHILKYEMGLWVFLQYRGTPLTNNEAERCLRGSVIMRKICYGTNSDRGDKFRSRLLSVIETSKKRGLNALNMIETIVTAVMRKHEYPDVFGLIAD